jgi:hypothetical protein
VVLPHLLFGEGIVSFVSFDFMNPEAFVFDQYRLNVALSRARQNLQLVGNLQELGRCIQQPELKNKLPHLDGIFQLFSPMGPYYWPVRNALQLHGHVFLPKRHLQT